LETMKVSGAAQILAVLEHGHRDFGQAGVALVHQGALFAGTVLGKVGPGHGADGAQALGVTLDAGAEVIAPIGVFGDACAGFVGNAGIEPELFVQFPFQRFPGLHRGQIRYPHARLLLCFAAAGGFSRGRSFCVLLFAGPGKGARRIHGSQ
jgi:hypothetical protein